MIDDKKKIGEVVDLSRWYCKQWLTQKMTIKYDDGMRKEKIDWLKKQRKKR